MQRQLCGKDRDVSKYLWVQSVEPKVMTLIQEWFTDHQMSMMKRRKGDKGHIIGCETVDHAIDLALTIRK